MTAQERAADGEVAAHLETCADCREFVASIKKFDQQFSSVLQSVPVADDLLSRLLKEVDSDVATPLTMGAEPDIAAKVGKRHRLVTFSRAIVAGLAVAVIVAVSGVWNSVPDDTTFDYAVARSTLTEKFYRIPASEWSQFAPFDHASFDVDRLDRVVRNWSLSQPVGWDLGNDAGHDVAAFQFVYERSSRRKWSGTLLVLPTRQYTGTPQESLPTSSSSSQVLEWQSADGTLTYLCFVEKGSAEELKEAMFGSIS